MRNLVLIVGAGILAAAACLGDEMKPPADAGGGGGQAGEGGPVGAGGEGGGGELPGEGEGEPGRDGDEGEGAPAEGEGEPAEGEGEPAEGEGEPAEGEGEPAEGEGEPAEGEGEPAEGEGEPAEGEGEPAEGEGEPDPTPACIGGCGELQCDEASGRCVACTEDAHCDGGACHPQTRECVECVGDERCGEGRLCVAGGCVERGPCVRDGDCQADPGDAGDGRQRCDLRTGHCVQCTRHGECSVGELCTDGACVPGCRDDGDCPDEGPTRCLPDQSACVVCFADAHCVALGLGDAAWCVGGRCERPCRFSWDCAEGLVCDGATGRCVACLDNGDCDLGHLCREQACVPGCEDVRDCPGDLRCSPADRGDLAPRGQCVECWEDAHCDAVVPPDGAGGRGICVDGGCRAGCRDAGACAAGQVCDQGALTCRACLPPVALGEPDECGEGSACVAGVCRTSCAEDAACAGSGFPFCGAGGTCVECRSPEQCGGYGCSPEGRCAVSAACRRFETEAFCLEGVQDDGRAFCEVHVFAGGNGRLTCNAYCGGFGAACIDGWNDGAGRCDHAERGECERPYNRQVCRCAR